jgi:uncharacterized low-complexity protein
MQTPKFNLALSVGTILLAGSTLTACSSNPFSAEKAAEPAKTEAAKPAEGKCGAKQDGKCGAMKDGKCGAAKADPAAKMDAKAK